MGGRKSRKVALLVLHSAPSPRSSLRNSINPSTSPLGNHLTWPFRIMCTTSYPNRPPCPVKRSEPLTGADPSFDRSMILFHDVVEVRTGTTPTPTTQFALLLQFRHRLGIGGVAVDVDHPGARVTRSKQGVPEEALSGSGIPPGGKQEIDRSTGRVDGPVQVGPLAFHPNVSLIHPPGAIGGLQLLATTLIQFRRIALDPSPDGSVVGSQAALGEKFLDVPIGERKSQISPNRTGDHRGFEVAPFEQRRL